jgi:predicted GTPase
MIKVRQNKNLEGAMRGKRIIVGTDGAKMSVSDFDDLADYSAQEDWCHEHGLAPYTADLSRYASGVPGVFDHLFRAIDSHH